jgi:apolipoprotein N-acyltransferase
MRRATVLVLLIAVCSNLRWKQLPPPRDWQALSATRQGHSEFDFREQLQARTLGAGARVVVLPEGAIGGWTPATEAFWEFTIRELATRDKAVIITAPRPTGSSLINSTFSRGADDSLDFSQRVPVPIAMWNPFRIGGSFEMNALGPSNAIFLKVRVAPLICYEQLLAWTSLTAVAARPAVLLGIGNAEWTHDTVVPSVQSACLRSWARLFSIPYLEAVKK